MEWGGHFSEAMAPSRVRSLTPGRPSAICAQSWRPSLFKGSPIWAQKPRFSSSLCTRGGGAVGAGVLGTRHLCNLFRKAATSCGLSLVLSPTLPSGWWGRYFGSIFIVKTKKLSQKMAIFLDRE